MDIHKNAKLTPRGRQQLVDHVRKRGALEGEAPLLGFDASQARLPSPLVGEAP